MKKVGIRIILCSIFLLFSCNQRVDKDLDLKVTHRLSDDEVKVPVVELENLAISASLSADRLDDSELRSLNIKLEDQRPKLDLRVGQKVPVHLFFTDGVITTYKLVEFTVFEHNKLKFKTDENETFSVQGVQVNPKNEKVAIDKRDWWVCGYIGGVADKPNDMSNKKILFDGTSNVLSNSKSSRYVVAPYAFPWKKFKWKSGDNKENIIKNLVFKPQGFLLRVKLTNRAADNRTYRPTGFRILSGDLSPKVAYTINIDNLVEGKYNPSLNEAEQTYSFEEDRMLNSFYRPLNTGELKKGEATEYFSWLWFANLGEKKNCSLRCFIKGEGAYTKPLIATNNITLNIPEGKTNHYDALNIVLSPKRPWLPLDYLSPYNVRSLDGSRADEVTDEWDKGELYTKSALQALKDKMPKNRRFPNINDWCSILPPAPVFAGSSAGDEGEVVWGVGNRGYVHVKADRNSNRTEAWKLFGMNRVIFRGINGAADIAKVYKDLYYYKPLELSNYKNRKNNTFYALRCMEENPTKDKYFSAWRYQFLGDQTHGLKVEVVYLGPNYLLSDENLLITSKDDYLQKRKELLDKIAKPEFWEKASNKGMVAVRRYPRDPNNTSSYHQTAYITVLSPDDKKAKGQGDYFGLDMGAKAFVEFNPGLFNDGANGAAESIWKSGDIAAWWQIPNYDYDGETNGLGYRNKTGYFRYLFLDPEKELIK